MPLQDQHQSFEVRAIFGEVVPASSHGIIPASGTAQVNIATSVKLHTSMISTESWSWVFFFFLNSNYAYVQVG